MRYLVIFTGLLSGITIKIHGELSPKIDIISIPLQVSNNESYNKSILSFSIIPRLPLSFKEKISIDENSTESFNQKIKIFIFTKGEILFPDDFNIYRMRRSSLENFQLREIAQVLAEFKELVRYASKNKINLEFHTEIDNASLRLINQNQLFTQDFLENVLGTKFNYNIFDANDKIYRGPFDHVFVIHPLLNDDSLITKLNQIPTSVIGYYTHSLVDFKDGLAQKLFEQWNQSQSPEDQKLYQERVGVLPFSDRDSGYLKSIPGKEGCLEEGGQYRKGFSILLDKEQSTSLFKKPGAAISFDYSAGISDPYQINFKGFKGCWSIGLGLPLKKEELSFLNLSSLSQEICVQLPENIGMIEEISIEPIKSARYFERSVLSSIPLSIQNWSISDKSPTPFGESPSLLDSLQLDLRNLIVTTTNEKNFILESLKSNSNTVRINALKKVKDLKLKEGLEKTIECLSHANPLVAETAAETVASLDIKEGWEALLKQIDRGFFDHNRIAAVKQFLNRPYPGLEIKLSTLLTCLDWHGRYEAVKVLLSLKTVAAKNVLLVFLHEIEPSIRFLIIKNLDINSDFICKCLLWNAINDVSEKVRNISYLRLLECSYSEYKEEALKATRNESVEIRLGLLTQMALQPNESYRTVLQYAVVDDNPKIRAAALKGFANLPGKVDKLEIENTFEDLDLEVQTALTELKAKKGL